MTTKAMPDYAGLREWRKNPQTGHYVGLYDGEAAGMDTDGGRWQTVCEEHGHIISHTTLALARSHMAVPIEWCEGCQDEAGDTPVTPEPQEAGASK